MRAAGNTYKAPMETNMTTIPLPTPVLGRRLDVPLFALSGGVILLFCLWALFDLKGLSVCTLLAGGGVFWAAGEPMAHFISSPPLFGAESKSAAAAWPALAQAYLHWGFLAWAILGSLTTIMLMHYHYDKGLPLAPRTLLYPVFGDRAINGPIGTITDAVCIIAVVAGTVGPIGFLGLQVAYGLHTLFGIPNGFATQAIVIGALVCIYTLSAVSGINRGIQLLSAINIWLAFILIVFILVVGPTSFIFEGFFKGMGVYLTNFFPMAMYRRTSPLAFWCRSCSSC